MFLFLLKKPSNYLVDSSVKILRMIINIVFFSGTLVKSLSFTVSKISILI